MCARTRALYIVEHFFALLHPKRAQYCVPWHTRRLLLAVTCYVALQIDCYMALEQVHWESVVCTVEMHGGSIFTLLSTYSDALCFVSTRCSIAIVLANHKSIPLQGFSWFLALSPHFNFSDSPTMCTRSSYCLCVLVHNSIPIGARGYILRILYNPWLI